MIKVSGIVFGFVFMVAACRADIRWEVASAAILGPDDVSDRAETSFTTPLQPSGAFFTTDGYMVQLIFAGANGVPDPIPSLVPAGFENDSAVGAQNDDVVVLSRWIGAGVSVEPRAGLVQGGIVLANDIAGNYFVRAWAGISQDPDKTINTDQTINPTARLPLPHNDGTHLFWWYGDSGTITSPGDGVGPPPLHFFDFSTPGQFAANNLVVSVIPEPRTFLLVALGVLLVTARLRRAG